jgi:endonuclease/exonuclease/phosphatase family metal-dependent hydrolase
MLRHSPLWRVAAAVLLVGFAAGCDTPGSETADVIVMSQNLYLGADLFLVANEPNPQLIPLRVAQLYAMVQATDFPARAKSIAAEIERQRPDLIGLQEVSTYYIQSPGDNLPGQPGTPATQVTIDFLAILQAELQALGLNYTTVSVLNNSDVELPATTDGVSFFDVRYRDADVILARQGVTTSNPVTRHFNALVTVPVGGVDQTYIRGYQSVQATVDGKALTFFNTHLEVGGAAAPVQEAQAVELKAALDATSGTVILAGDLNSDANGSTTASYGILTEASTQPLRDVFPASTTTEPTCCQDDDLRNGVSTLTRRIDFVLYRGAPTSVQGETVLDRPQDRVQSAAGLLWPSDHAGVVGRFVFEL